MRKTGLGTLGGLLAATGMAAALSACSPVIKSHGYTPLEEDLARIQIGQDTRGSVRRKIGRPGTMGIFTDEGWYYVSSKVEHLTYHEPTVIERNVIAVVFDDQDVVASVNRYALEDGRVIDLETNTTPTYGRQLTILEQAFGNIGAITGSIFEE